MFREKSALKRTVIATCKLNSMHAPQLLHIRAINPIHAKMSKRAISLLNNDTLEPFSFHTAGGTKTITYSALNAPKQRAERNHVFAFIDI